MNRSAPILVAAEPGDSSDEAIRQADARARLQDVPLLVRTVVPDVLQINPLAPTLPLPYDVSHLRTHVEERMRERVSELTRRAAETLDVRVLEGTAHAAILEEAERLGAGLIVVGSHGRKGIARLLLGSVAERIVRYAECPVLVARPRTLAGCVLVATDFSDSALPAVQAGVEEAAAKEGRVMVAHCIDLTGLDWIGSTLGAAPVPLAFSANVLADMRREAERRIVAALSSCGGVGEALVLDGDPATAILDAAKRVDAELIVVGTAGRTGLRRAALGSVAESVVRGASTSVLVVRLGAEST